MSEQVDPQAAAAIDSGLVAVLMLLRYHGIGADPGQIQHRFGGGRFGIAEMLRCAKEFSLRARAFSTDWRRLANTSFPAIAALKDGNFLIIGKLGDGKILELPKGYDTIVGERSATLSGGQRQRIAIALVTNPRIVIFDEATSQLDHGSERIIQQNMERIAKNRTVIIIAHRLSTVRRCHRILTIERGRLVEDGSHDDLIRTGGRYASLHRLQSGIHEIIG
jgi:ABC-type bacteriocin/lantibiotic exporter with double-glycine peptidase domain